jgi:hypothetical protein
MKGLHNMSLTKRWAHTQERTPAQRLEEARTRVHAALRTAEEGPLDYQSSDDIARALVAAMRDMDTLKMQLMVAERTGR